MNLKKNKIDQTNFEILTRLSKEPNISQRQLSKILGISLGKLNYCIKDLINNNLIKINDIKIQNKKKQFTYTLTNSGISAKKKFALKFVNENIDDLGKILKNKNKTLGIGHNSSFYDEVLEENKIRTKPLFKTIAINIKRRTVIVDDICSDICLIF